MSVHTQILTRLPLTLCFSCFVGETWGCWPLLSHCGCFFFFYIAKEEKSIENELVCVEKLL